jgi:hypothetical protein
MDVRTEQAYQQRINELELRGTKLKAIARGCGESGAAGSKTACPIPTSA